MTLNELTYFVLTMVCTSLWCAGLWAVFLPEFLLGSVGDWLEAKLPSWLFKPTVGCLLCMSSVHGTTSFLICLSDMVNGWWYFLPFVLGVAGLNFIIMNSRK